MAAGRRLSAGRRRVVALAAASAVVAGCGTVPPAPATSTFPVTPGAQVVAAAAGGSQVNAARDHNRYRYIAVSGPPNVPGSQLIATQLRSLVTSGWGQPRSVGFVGTATTARPVPVTATGAEVMVNSPDHREYAAMSLLPDRTAASELTAGTPLSQNPAIGQALSEHEPVLWVVLGNGTHS